VNCYRFQSIGKVCVFLSFLLLTSSLYAQSLEFVFSGDPSPATVDQLRDALRQHPAHARHRITLQRNHVWMQYISGTVPSETWISDLLNRKGLQLECFFRANDPDNQPDAQEQFRACMDLHRPNGKTASFNTCNTPVDICDNSNLNVAPWGPGTLIITSPQPPKNPEYGPFSGPSPWVNPWNGGTNYGCLQSGELNTIWTRIVVSGAGNLEWAFTFPEYDGFNFIYMDWSLFPLTPTICADIAANNANSAPLRCNWNDFPASPIAATGMSTVAASIPIANEEDNFEVSFPVTPGQQFLMLMDNWSAGTFVGNFDFSLSASSAQVCGTVLPAGHTELVAQAEASAVELGWINLDAGQFVETVIERSAEQSRFEDLQELTPFQFQQERRFGDAEPIAGTAYYRIRRVDADGQISYSNTAEVHWEGQGFSIHPQPNSGQFRIHAPTGAESLRIFDGSGKMVLQKAASRGNATDFQVDTNLVPGWYTAVLTSADGQVHRRKLIVQ
jgi:hypothetical protein